MLEVNCNKNNIILGVIYRHVSNTIAPFIAEMDNILHSLSNCNTYVLMGDFNIAKI